MATFLEDIPKPSTTGKATGSNRKIFNMFEVILIVLSSGYDVNIVKDFFEE